MNTSVSTLIYLFNTYFVYVFCVAVLLHYWQEGILFKVKKWESYDWLIIGILVSFMGKILDGLYWQITWTAVTLNLPVKELLLHYGTLANIPFRQIPILLACACHLKAAWMMAHSSTRNNRFWGLILRSAIYGTALYSLGHLIVVFLNKL